MAAVREIHNVTWDDTAEGGETVVLDVSNEDCLMWHTIGGGANNVFFEGSLNGTNWATLGAFMGGDAFDAYVSYHSSGSSNELYTIPTFAAAPLRWLKFTLNAPPSTGTTVQLVVYGGVIGR